MLLYSSEPARVTTSGFSFTLLKDGYDAIQLLCDKNGASSLPYSFWFRGNQSRLRTLGFDSEQIKNIFGFLDYVDDSRQDILRNAWVEEN
jgi:hypothetical protein